jgi:predicted nuclease with TOPRIM domain
MGDHDKDERAASTLGERLLEGVRNLWREVNSHRRVIESHGKVIEHQGREHESLKERVAKLEGELRTVQGKLRGVRISKGMAEAKVERLEATVAESKEKLHQIKSVLN